MTRTRHATGETVLVPSRNRRSKVDRITGDPGKSIEDETVAAGSVVAVKRSNFRGAKGPYCTSCFRQHERQGCNDKGAHYLQDLRRRLYVKRKAESPWRLRVPRLQLETVE
jgi:hypothetical protein